MLGFAEGLKGGARIARRLCQADSYAALLERLVLMKRYRLDAPQLFILGLPRTGTTLIYQYIVHRMQVAYFTNGVGRFPRAACLATYLQHKMHGPYHSDFESRYGKVSGAVAPREAGGFWGQFFPLDDYVTYRCLSEETVRRLRNTIGCVQRIFAGAPFVNKNIKHLLRVDALSKVFPDSRFLVVERDLADVALSLLHARQEVQPNPRQWWSAKPPDYEKLKELPLVEQVAGQVVSLKQKIERDLADLPSARVLRITYEGFCRGPESLIEELVRLLKARGAASEPIRCFKCSRREPCSEDEKKVVQLVKRAAGR